MSNAARRWLGLAGIGLVCLTILPEAWAGPPAYLLLRRTEAPAKCNQPGKPDAARFGAPTSGYAYGYFGAAPRSHASRHFGYYRTYTSWATW